MNALLVIANSEGVIHAHLHLPWLARMYCWYVGELLGWPVEREEYLLRFCKCLYDELVRKATCTPIFAQIFVCQRFKCVAIAFIPIDHSIFLPTKEV